MQRGTSVRLCTSGIAFRISSISSASGSPTLTSSMSAPPAICCATSISMRERSPCCSSAWNFLRPVGLMRSPMMQNGRSGPITMVLDDDSRTVSTQLPLFTGGDAEAGAQACDPRLLAKADQVQAAHARDAPRRVGELAADLEALHFRIRRALDALDQRGRHRDARHVLVDVAQRLRGPHEADRGQDRDLLREPARDRLGHEALERAELEADLQLEELRARAHLLERA